MADKCLVPECKKEQGPRGLCNAHMATAKGLIKKKLVTEEQLVSAGKILPKPLVRTTTQRWFLDGTSKKTTTFVPATRAADRLPQDPTPEEIRQRAQEQIRLRNQRTRSG